MRSRRRPERFWAGRERLGLRLVFMGASELGRSASQLLVSISSCIFSSLARAASGVIAHVPRYFMFSPTCSGWSPRYVTHAPIPQQTHLRPPLKRETSQDAEQGASDNRRWASKLEIGAFISAVSELGRYASSTFSVSIVSLNSRHAKSCLVGVNVSGGGGAFGPFFSSPRDRHPSITPTMNSVRLTSLPSS